MIKLAAALVASLAAHAALFSGWYAPATSLQIATPSVPPASASEIAALEAFAALDFKRAQMAQANDTLISEMASIELPRPAIDAPPILAVPMARPASLAARADAGQPPPNQASSKQAASKQAGNKTNPAPVKAKNENPTQAAPATNTSASAAASAAAYQEFGRQVHAAFLGALRAPRNVENVRAKIQLRFVNGRFHGAEIALSSGNIDFDKALLAAAKRARFPNAPGALAVETRYNIPVKI